jgi:hypothetical protein
VPVNHAILRKVPVKPFSSPRGDMQLNISGERRIKSLADVMHEITRRCSGSIPVQPA